MKRTFPWRGLAYLCVSVMLGCATHAPPAPKVNLSGFPPAFQDGYADGCKSASGRLHQDRRRYAEDRQYAAGWRDGLDGCKRQQAK